MFFYRKTIKILRLTILLREGRSTEEAAKTRMNETEVAGEAYDFPSHHSSPQPFWKGVILYDSPAHNSSAKSFRKCAILADSPTMKAKPPAVPIPSLAGEICVMAEGLSHGGQGGAARRWRRPKAATDLGPKKSV
jgi:hypothetical protein